MKITMVQKSDHNAEAFAFDSYHKNKEKCVIY